MLRPPLNYTISAPGYPDRSPDLDALPGFQEPPPGYGEVPFWWWSGDALDVDRMLWQVRELHSKGISGFQVNYSHHDTPGWPTDTAEPELFTAAWWQVYGRISRECGRLGMGIGLSTYTLDWPNGGDNLFRRLFYSRPELNAIELVAGERRRLRDGETDAVPCVDDLFAARAYEVRDGTLQRGGIDLTHLVQNGRIAWTAPAGEWEVWTFGAARRDGTLNSLMPGAGDTVIRGFYQKFEDHAPDTSCANLNYFFNDELKVGLGKLAWNGDFLAEFCRRKGYDLMEVLPAMWADMGDITPKVRIDYADVRMSLMEERYFEPVYRWHASRGIIFGCDNHGRGLEPDAYGDYYRAIRWYTAPGHDTPGGKADLIKGKVSSSIASLYQLPRVQLEGYHSLGWGATTEQITKATCENYLYGCNLLSLHGFYTTTFGSHWEWAPPSYHFRMPYWNHMGGLLKYVERLSYLMSQGRHVCDVAVIYPVVPYEAELNGTPPSRRHTAADMARDAAFELGRKLMAAGINFDFIDHQSLARAVVEGDRLIVKDAGASYRALVFPDMDAVRWLSLEKAAAFAQAGGNVLALGALPAASDRAGRNDAELSALNEQAFRPDRRLNSTDEAVNVIRDAFVQDVRAVDGTVQAQHRKVGPRDVYLVMGAEPGDVVEFRAKGRVEIWDAWTGNVAPLRVVAESATRTQVVLPLERCEAQIVVFTPDAPRPSECRMRDAGQELGARSGQRGTGSEARAATLVRDLTDSRWRVGFEPTMDNRFGDFRLPVTPANGTVGVEARRFAWARETAELANSAMLPTTDDSAWETQLHGHGPQFYLLGPVPETVDVGTLDAELAKLGRVDPAVPVTVDGRTFRWRLYEFSWRYGREGDPGHQGFHGLKGTIADHFIRLGERENRVCGATVLNAEARSRYYLWSCVAVSEPTAVTVHVSSPAPAATNASPVNTPAAVFIGGKRVSDLTQPVSLEAGLTALLVRYDDHGESHIVLRRHDTPLPAERQRLAMRWYNDPGVIPFDPYAGEAPAEWFRFLSAPGTIAIHVQAQSRGPVQAWLDGKPMVDKGNGRFEARRPVETAAVVALRLSPRTGRSGGAAIPEPIAVETSGSGIMPLGDWAELGVLNNYSGGVRYRTTVTLTAEQARGDLTLDLGRVVATAEVSVNGQKAGVRPAPPWTFDVAGLLEPGENDLEVLVYNTLANHYQTIPSLYRGEPTSGLFGPVRVLTRGEEE